MPYGKSRSLTVRVSLGLAVMVALMVAVAAYAVWTVSVNQSSHRLLAGVNQLETSLRAIERRAENYVAAAPRNYPDYHRDLVVYHQHLQDDLDMVESTIQDIVSVQESPTASSDDQPAKDLDQELASLAGQWAVFRRDLDEVLGPDEEEPRLEWGAEFIVAEIDDLLAATNQLAGITRNAVESRRERILHLGAWGGAGALGFALLLMVWFYRTIIQRIHTMSRAFHHAGQGDLDHHVPVTGADELTLLARDYNRMATRLQAFIRLLDRVQMGTDPETTLDYLWHELHRQMDIDCLALMELDPSGIELRLRHQQSSNGAAFPGEPIPVGDPHWSRSLESGREIHFDTTSGNLPVALAGMGSAIILPLPSNRRERLLLAAGSTRAEAFDEDLVALFRNAAELIGHAFDKSAFAERLLLAVITGLARLAERRDPETGDHLLRMARYSGVIAEELTRGDVRLNGAFPRDVERFAPLHDIGKVGIDDRILRKKGKLTAEGRQHMKRHPLIGGEVLRHCANELGEDGEQLFAMAVEIAEGHHEKYDGSGYPRGLKAEEIPLAARIVATADVFDALTSRRPYKRAWSVEEALEHMERESGRHFDPAVLDAMKSGMDRIMTVYWRYRHV